MKLADYFSSNPANRQMKRTTEWMKDKLT